MEGIQGHVTLALECTAHLLGELCKGLRLGNKVIHRPTECGCSRLASGSSHHHEGGIDLPNRHLRGSVGLDNMRHEIRTVQFPAETPVDLIYNLLEVILLHLLEGLGYTFHEH